MWLLAQTVAFLAGIRPAIQHVKQEVELAYDSTTCQASILKSLCFTGKFILILQIKAIFLLSSKSNEVLIKNFNAINSWSDAPN